MRIYYKYLYVDQPTHPTWSVTISETLQDFLKTIADSWEYYVPSTRGMVVGFGDNVAHGVILVDSAGRLVFQRGTDIQVLKASVPQPKSLRLIPPELRRPV